MTNQKKIQWALALGVVLVLAYATWNTQQQPQSGLNIDSLLAARPVLVTPENYRVQLARARFQKDVFFKNEAESPISNRQAFRGLHYFDPDTNFCIQAVFVPQPAAKPVAIQMTNGSTESLQPLGQAIWGQQAKLCTLTVYRSSEAGQLFIPFKDKTAPAESYGAGRFLDLSEKAIQGQRISIDFNLAYNPFCAYNSDYTCPIPPKENTLEVAIRAGEKKYH
jgi:uncharacterized protein